MFWILFGEKRNVSIWNSFEREENFEKELWEELSDFLLPSGMS